MRSAHLSLTKLQAKGNGKRTRNATENAMKTRMQRIAITLVAVMMIQGVIHDTISYARPRSSQEAGALSLPDGRVGQSYEYQLRTEGGLLPLSWRVVEGELPPGMRLEPNGRIAGVPTLPRRQAFNFVVEVSDSSQTPQRFAQPFTLMIQAAPLRMVMEPGKLKIVVPTTAAQDYSEPGRSNGSSVAVLASKLEKPEPAAEPKDSKITWPSSPTRQIGNGSSLQVVSGRKDSPYNNNPDPSVAEESGEEALNPAYFVKIYEVPKARSKSFQQEAIRDYGESAKIYGKLIYDGRTAGLNNTRMTADEGSTIAVVPDVSGRDIAFNTIYMAAELASGDKKQNVEVVNYSEVGTAPSADAFIIGASFRSARDVLDKLITLQRRATDILKPTLEFYDPQGEIPQEKLNGLLDSETVLKDQALLDRAKRNFALYAAEIESISGFLLDSNNRNIVERVANYVFNLDQATLVAIAKQFTTDLALISSDASQDTRNLAVYRLLLRTRQIYIDFQSARAVILNMTRDYESYTPPTSSEKSEPPERKEMVTKLQGLQKRIMALKTKEDSTSDPDEKARTKGLRVGLEMEAAKTARDIYAYDTSSVAITNLRKTKFPVGWLSLDDAKAQDGDSLKVTVRVQNPDGQGTGNKVPFYVAVKKYGIKLHWASSFMFLKRLNITDADAQPKADGTTLSKVNYAPSPGMSYGFTYFKRGDSAGDKFARVLAPTIGMNVSFMNFKDPGFDLVKNMFTNTKGTDVQVGAGPVFSLFNNKLDFTYGWNLNVDRKRNYFGIGFGFIEIAKELTKYVKNQ